MKKTILIVEDESDLAELVEYNLKREGFKTICAYDGNSAIKIIQEMVPDLIILDLMLPGISGLEICKLIRNRQPNCYIPIIMLTARSEEVDRILGLEMGADDYITKPFSTRELVARVKAVLRRMEYTAQKEDQEEKIIKRGNLTINLTKHIVQKDNKEITLSPSEYRILVFLITNPGIVFSRQTILDRAWGDEVFVEPRTVDVHIKRLRNKIEDDPSNPQYILTVRGFGYKFSDKL